MGDDLDFDVWQQYKFSSGTDWRTGDFNGDNVTDVLDFNLWHSRRAGAQDASVTPEPYPFHLASVVFATLAQFSRCRRTKTR